MSDDLETSPHAAPLGAGELLRGTAAGELLRGAAAGEAARGPAVGEALVSVVAPPAADVAQRGGGGGRPPISPDGGEDGGGPGGLPPRPRLRKLRLLLVLSGLAVLAVVSTVFGMLTAVASDLPQLENTQQYAIGHDSYLYDDHWRPIGIFAPPNHEVIDGWKQISPAMIHAIIAVEDRRFWSDPGVDIRGIARALLADITGRATQGASTIAQQFVKNTLHQENNRTVLEKLREAALAFQLTHRWRRTKILTEYLNSIYFGHGAYGVESAARVYFGERLGYDPNAPADGGRSACGDSTLRLPSCASRLRYWQAALLAGIVANPSAFDPIAHPRAARARRDVVLRDMLFQRYITRAQYEYGRSQPLPAAGDLQLPQEPAAAPYFTSWLRPQILAAMGMGRGVPQNVAEYRAYYGGLKIRTTLDLRLQQAAEQAIASEIPYGPGEPAVSLVAIDNRTGEVRAMVGGPIVGGREDYGRYPFNLATEAERQPGSAFKPFTLAVALEAGYGPGSLFLSAPANFVVPHTHGREIFHVRNFGNTYSGVITLQEATDVSDNSVYARLGIEGLGPNGTRRIAALARAMGIRTPVSDNYAMILGGLKVGVSPLDIAHAYETFATGGERVYDPQLGAPDKGPIGIAEIRCPRVCPRKDIVARPQYERVLPAAVAAEVRQMLEGVVQSGTGTQAAISGVLISGKTGTTTNYGDAWFVGWTPQLTTAVWVGFPSRLVPMTNLYNGGPVEGGTFPAIIWHDFMVQALQILASEQQGASGASAGATATTTGPASGVAQSTTATQTATAPAASTGASTQTGSHAGPPQRSGSPAGPSAGGGGGGGTVPTATAPATGGGAGTGGGSGATGTTSHSGSSSGSGSGSAGGTGGAGIGGGGGG
jgi:penicillin-binding protein 1A